MEYDEIVAMEDGYQLKTYEKYPFAAVKGKGCYVWDTTGKKYVDFYGGHAVCLTGHCHPNVVKAIREQSEQLIFYSNIVYSEIRAKLSKLMIESAPKGLTKVFFCNSGAEANETAVKIARKFTGKKAIIAMKNGFHGRTIATLSVTGIEKYRAQFSPIIENTYFADFGSMESVRKIVSEHDDIAAVMLEPIQSMGGMATSDSDYFKQLRKLCDEKKMLLIFDEVQTGFGRTGKMFASDYYGVTPDLISCAKGIASGVPMGATIIKDEIAQTIKMGEHGSTFGGGQVACAAAYASLKTVIDERLADNAEAMGKYTREKFKVLKIVKEVRGAGLLVGLKLACEAKPVVQKLLEQGYITGTAVTEKDVMRLMPPLTIGKSEIDGLYEALKTIGEAMA